MRKQALKRGFVYRHNDETEFFLLEPKTLYTLIAVSVLTLLVYFFGADARLFLTDVVNPLPEHAPFDGAVAPVKQVPNWVKLTEAERKAAYSAIPQEKFIPLPPYIPERLAIPFEKLEWNNASHDQIRNEKITYTTPYLGNYEGDGRENAGSHLAVDIKVPEGTPVYSIANGVVIKVAPSSSGFGMHAVIQHDKSPLPNDSSQTETLYSSYSHMSQILAQERQVVTKGQLIGYSGQSGFATTPHVHFQLDRDNVPWHPYWAFTGQEAKDAGLSFVGAINAGLGKDRAIASTLNPMKYVQQFQSGSLVAGAVTIPPPQIIQPVSVQDDFIFKVEIPAVEIFEGAKIPVTIHLYDAQGNLRQKTQFEDRIKVDLLNGRAKLNRKFLTAGFFITGETNVVELSETTPGAEKILVHFRDQEYVSEEFEIKAKAPATSDVPVSPAPATLAEQPLTPKSFIPEDRNRMIFPRLEIQQSKTFLALGESVEFLAQYFDAETQNVTPPSGLIYFLSVLMGEGTFTPSVLRAEDFIDGKTKFTFTPLKTGQTAIVVNGGALMGSSDGIDVKEAVPTVTPQPENQTPPTSHDTPTQIFTDITAGNEYETALKYLKEYNVIGGYPDGSFQPDKEVLRVEALKMIFQALQEAISQNVGNLLFPDLQTGAWYLPYVQKAFSDSVVQGYPDGTFRPNANVNMVEFYKMLFLAAKTDINPEIIVQLPNGITEDDWFAPYLQEATRKNILDIKENPLQPGKSMTRGNVANALYRLMVLQETGRERFE